MGCGLVLGSFTRENLSLGVVSKCRIHVHVSARTPGKASEGEEDREEVGEVKSHTKAAKISVSPITGSLVGGMLKRAEN